MEPKKPKILYGITKSNFGGAQRYVFDLATEIRKKDFEVLVLCGGNGPLVDKLRDENIQVITLPSLGRDISLSDDLKSFIFIYKTLRKEKPDVFHINSSKMGLGALAGILAGTKKIIFTLHGFAWNENRPPHQKIVIKLLTWLTIFLSHKTICVAEQARTNVSTWPFIKNKLLVIKNGVSEFSLVERTDQNFTVGAISELHPIKGLDILLKAWGEFVKHNRGSLIIYGDGQERHNLENMAQNLGIYDTVVFKGFVENAKGHLSEFDIFVLPSRSEGMPYSLLEAGMAGLATIATSVGGIPEVINNHTSGLLISKENPGELLKALETLCTDQNLRMKLGQNIKETIHQSFTLEKMVRDTIKVYV